MPVSSMSTPNIPPRATSSPEPPVGRQGRPSELDLRQRGATAHRSGSTRSVGDVAEAVDVVADGLFTQHPRQHHPTRGHHLTAFHVDPRTEIGDVVTGADELD